MNKHLNHAPCGFVLLSTSGIIQFSNQTLCEILGYDMSHLVGKHVNVILAKPAQMFMQLYFFPLVTAKHHVNEMYLSLVHENGEEIPVLMNASLSWGADEQMITCIMMPIQKRNEYENQLLIAKKVAEDALKEKDKANSSLEETLDSLLKSQEELLMVNKQNRKYNKDIQDELQLAKKIQENSQTEAISNEYIEMRSHYHASKELSGDNYGFYQINDHQYGAILLDVMGNGISSALISMSMHSLFQRLITVGTATDRLMKELDNYLHTLFHNNQDSWHYCTAIYLIIDTKKQTVECTNAGHASAILQNADGDQWEFHSTSPPVGAFEGTTFKVDTFHYDKGSRILLYTDGVSEPLGESYLKSLLKDSANDALGQVKGSILSSLEMKEEKKMKDDDQCFILIDLH